MTAINRRSWIRVSGLAAVLFVVGLVLALTGGPALASTAQSSGAPKTKPTPIATVSTNSNPNPGVQPNSNPNPGISTKATGPIPQTGGGGTYLPTTGGAPQPSAPSPDLPVALVAAALIIAGMELRRFRR